MVFWGTWSCNIEPEFNTSNSPNNPIITPQVRKVLSGTTPKSSHPKHKGASKLVWTKTCVRASTCGAGVWTVLRPQVELELNDGVWKHSVSGWVGGTEFRDSNAGN